MGKFRPRAGNNITRAKARYKKYYKAGWVLIKETLYGTNKKPCGALNVKKHGFFLIIKGKKPLIVNTLAYYYMVR